MAAIDPDASPEYEDDADSSKPPRATLKIIRIPDGMEDDEDSDDDDYEDEDELDSEEDSDDEEINGGPSDKEKAKQLKEAAAFKELADAMAEDDTEDDSAIDIASVISKLLKGKAPATDDDDDDEDDDEEGLELEEVVVCTLDTQKVSNIPVTIPFFFCLLT
jgi:FK506-binding nuclear protein